VQQYAARQEGGHFKEETRKFFTDRRIEKEVIKKDEADTPPPQCSIVIIHFASHRISH
jgi:hypothetical protein